MPLFRRDTASLFSRGKCQRQAVRGKIAESTDLIDLSAPAGVLVLAVLHFITDDGMDPETAKAAQDVYADASAPAVPRGYAEILRFFDGMELVPRGLVDVNAWPFTDAVRTINPRVLMYGAVARKS